MRRSLISFICGVVMATVLTGCSRSHEHVLGTSSMSPVSPVSTAQHTAVSQPVAIQGVMVEKCPVAGCWFILRDKSGTIKVDTKAAGFTVVNIPLQTELTVNGRVAKNGSQKMITATGLRY